MTSAAAKVPLIRAVRQAAAKLDTGLKVFAGDVDAKALTRYVADEFWHMPATGEEVVETLIKGCRARGIGTIIPTRDGELLFWARNRLRFREAGIHVIVSPPASVEVCLDKLAFARYGRSMGLPVIPAGLHPAEVGAGPYVVKERHGAGARNIGLNLTQPEALRHGATLQAPVYQPFVSGREISADAWLDQSLAVKGVILRSRDHVVGGESKVTTTFRDEAIEREVTRVLTALQVSGPVVLQGMMGPRGGLDIIECNTRLGGASTAAIAAGLDLCYWSLLEVYGADVRAHPFVRISGEVRQIRVAEDIHLYGADF